MKSSDSTAIAQPTAPNQKEFVVYVPQGGTARISKKFLHTAVLGLYTDEFSTCSILIWMGENKISLAHLDKAINQTALTQALKNNKEWMDEKCDIVIVSREEGKDLKEKIADTIVTQLNVKPTLKEVDGSIYGVCVGFESDAKNFNMHPKVKLVAKNDKPQNLLHHPDEQKFITCSKIHFFLSVILKQRLTSNTVVYDEIGWEKIESAALQIDQEVNEIFVQWKGQGYDIITGDIVDIISEQEDKENKQIYQDEELMKIISNIVFYVESYIEDYDQNTIFTQNIKALLEEIPNEYKPTVEDNNYRDQFLAALTTKNSAFAEIEKVIEKYKVAPVSTYKNYLLKQIIDFSAQYRSRSEYTQRVNACKQKEKAINSLLNSAIHKYRAGDYRPAISLFLECLQLQTYYYVKSEAKLATIYYNLGRCYFMTEQQEAAQKFLMHAKFLEENYVKNKTSLKKINDTLAECESKVSKAPPREAPPSICKK